MTKHFTPPLLRRSPSETVVEPQHLGVPRYAHNNRNTTEGGRGTGPELRRRTDVGVGRTFRWTVRRSLDVTRGWGVRGGRGGHRPDRTTSYKEYRENERSGGEWLVRRGWDESPLRHWGSRPKTRSRGSPSKVSSVESTETLTLALIYFLINTSETLNGPRK